MTARSAAANALGSISDETWDRVVQDLERQGGMAIVQVPVELGEIHQQAFAMARNGLTQQSHGCEAIPADADSAHATGYHGPEGMSHYNAYREGFVFSDGNLMGTEPFVDAMADLFSSMHGLAQNILLAMERKWKLPVEWFQDTLGPTIDHSQWHVKRYVRRDITTDMEETPSEIEPVVLLPSHTDPSLISIVLIDRSGIQDDAMGLQYQGLSGDKTWIEIPQSGHLVATVFVGSVLSYITGGKVASAKHRVIQTLNNKDRMAATLFVRPNREALLQVPPSPYLESVALKKQMSFATWSARVSRNYSKGRAISSKNGANGRHTGKDFTVTPKLGYFKDDWTELSLIPCDPPLKGRDKYLGGELGNNGKIYTVPGHAAQVLVIDPTVEPPTVARIGPKFQGQYKWLRGVRMSTGVIYAVPCHADSILKIDPNTDTVSTLSWDFEDPMSPPKGLPWKWHGGNIAPSDGCLYCIPQFAEHVLKIDPITETVSFLGGPFPGQNKWYGGLVGPKDGAIYGIQQNASGVLRIDPVTQTATIHGSFPEGGHKWHGGVVGPDGCIYGIPAHADTVLKVEPDSIPHTSTIGGPLRTGSHRSDGKYKYLGGAVGHDGNVYFFPSDADHVLQVNPRTNEVREVGPNLHDLERINNNKWQNGFTDPSGTIYGIPLKSGSVLRIRPGDGTNPDVATIGGRYEGLNKWEGGVMSNSGDMFCMPLNHSMVLRMKPVAAREPKDSNGKAKKKTPQYATLRSSAHVVTYSKARARGLDSRPSVTSDSPLPNSMRQKRIFSYDSSKYDLRGTVVKFLRDVDPAMIGTWHNQEACGEHSPKLEAFVIAQTALQPSKSRAGQKERAQTTLSDIVASDKPFLECFDSFVTTHVIPWLKKQLIESRLASESEESTFYYQRPPTLRLQPGPSTRYVRPHCDADYGHQDGELNFWMPLTDPELTQTDLWVESEPGQKDYQPLQVSFGEVAAFHGSSCWHYVPANPTEHTRVSLDFRIGVKGYFDPKWKMLGTREDHNRREVTL